MELSTFDSLRYQSPFVLLAISLGATSALRFFLLVLKCLYVLFLRPSKNLAKYGRWAVITGPTDGIGKEMAMEFARKGLNLVLVGRNPEKLNKVSAELREVNSAVKLKTVVMDLSDEIQLRVLIDAVKDVDMGILVNNAGLANEDPVHFHQLGEDTTMKIVNVNLVAPTMITAALLPEMLRKGRGAIINVGSGSTDLPSFPFYSVYAGTKGYIKQFSKNLHIEYKQRGIHVQCQTPNLVATKMASMFSCSFFVATPSQYASSALQWIGYGWHCKPYWAHSLADYLVGTFLTENVINWATYRIINNIKRVVQKTRKCDFTSALCQP